MKPISITNAYTQRGWSSTDHLIDDSRMVELIGRDFSTVANAMRAARARADKLGYAAIEYLDNRTGERWLRGDEPPLPGREPLCRRLGERPIAREA